MIEKHRACLGPAGLLATLAVLAAPLAAEELIWPEQIEIITDSAHPVRPSRTLPSSVPVQTYDLNAPAKLEAELSEGLSRTLEEAQTEARRRIDSLGQDALRQRFTSAYGGLMKAMDYGVDRYPAVVFDDGVAVVYGVTDLDTALRHYRVYRARRVWRRP